MKGQILNILILGVLLGACSSIRIITEQDPQTDLSHMTDYAFLDEVSYQSTPFYEEEINHKIKEAIRHELDSRGYVESHSPDVWIDFSLFTENNIQLIDRPWFYNDEEGRDFMTNDFSIYQFEEEKLVVELRDVSQKKLIWRGMATRILDSYDTRKQEGRIEEAINILFKQYPFEMREMPPLSYYGR